MVFTTLHPFRQKAVVDQRLAQAGVRMAAYLNALFADAPPPRERVEA